MEALIINTKSSKLQELKDRAFLRKQREDLRHTPNISDISIANNNAKEMLSHQLDVIKKNAVIGTEN